MVFIAGEGGGQHGAQVFDKLLHIGAELSGVAGGQVEGVGFVRLVEVEDVTPIVGGGLLRRFVLEVLLHGRKLARSIWPQSKQIKPLVLDANTKTDGLNRPLLPDDIVQVG